MVTGSTTRIRKCKLNQLEGAAAVQVFIIITDGITEEAPNASYSVSIQQPLQCCPAGGPLHCQGLLYVAQYM